MVTKFVDHKHNGRMYNGYEISIPVDVREIYPEGDVEHLLPHEAYVVDPTKVVAIVPSVGYSYLKDEKRYVKAEEEKGQSCAKAGSARTEEVNAVRRTHVRAQRHMKRVLFCFPENDPINNNLFGDEEHSKKIEMVCVTYVAPHSAPRESGGNLEFKMPCARVVWRVTVDTEKARLVDVKDKKKAMVDDLASAFGEMNTGM